MLMSNLEVFVLQKGRRDNEPWSLHTLGLACDDLFGCV
jgi:hypothetical protein